MTPGSAELQQGVPAHAEAVRLVLYFKGHLLFAANPPLEHIRWIAERTGLSVDIVLQIWEVLEIFP